MNAPLFNRSALCAGMILGRRGTAPVSYAIMLRTAGPKAMLDGTAWSHDGILIQHNGSWYVGDAEMGQKAALVPLETWEAALRRGECRAIVLWPKGATEADGQAAAWYWQTNVQNSVYDELAIRQLAWRWLAEACGNKLGAEENYYCTEGCDAAWNSGTTFRPSPWEPKLNPTPGTTRKRAIAGIFTIVAGAFTEDGKRYAIDLKPKIRQAERAEAAAAGDTRMGER